MAATVTRWWWIRHAPVTGHGGRIYGQADHPADCSDAATFAALARLLPADGVWVTSRLQRTHQTAAALHAALRPDQPPPDWIVEPDLAEQNFGDWQGLSFDQLQAMRGNEVFTFWLSPASEVPPGGESFYEVVARVGPVVERLTAAHRGRDIIAVAHGGSIRAALAQALAIDAERVLSFAIANCSLTRLDHIHDPDSADADKEGWRVVTVNLPPTAKGLK